MTKREAAIIMATTGVCMLTGRDMSLFYRYLTELMGRPVYSHELPDLAPEIEELAKEDFLNLCRTLTD